MPPEERNFDNVLDMFGENQASTTTDADAFWEEAISKETSFDPTSLTEQELATYNHAARLILPYLQRNDSGVTTTNIYSFEMRDIIEQVLKFIPTSEFIIDTTLVVATKHAHSPDSGSSSLPVIPEWLSRNVMELIGNKMPENKKRAILNSNQRVLLKTLQSRKVDNTANHQLNLTELDQLNIDLLIPITTAIYILYSKLEKRLKEVRRIEATQAEIGLHIVKPIWNRINEVFLARVTAKQLQVINTDRTPQLKSALPQETPPQKELEPSEYSFALNILLLTTALYSQQEQIPAIKYDSLINILDESSRKEFLEKHPNPYHKVGNEPRYVPRTAYVDLVTKLLNQESNSHYDDPKLKTLNDEISLLVEDGYIDLELLNVARTDQQEKLKKIIDSIHTNEYQLNSLYLEQFIAPILGIRAQKKDYIKSTNLRHSQRKSSFRPVSRPSSLGIFPRKRPSI